MSTELGAGAEAGLPYPLGATWNGRGVNFAVFSEHGEGVQLCLFDDKGRKEVQRVPLRERTDGVWHAYLPQIRPGQIYGYRVAGPYEPANGHRFNANKLLLDPYARQMTGAFRWSDSQYGYRADGASADADLTFDKRDNARYVQKAVVVDGAFSWSDDRAPGVPLGDTVIYECHVKGFSALNNLVPEVLRGTYAGFAQPACIEYLKRLGVTTVQLMPVHEFIDDQFLVDKGLVNYWGYNSLNFFSPASRYLSTPDIREFKAMVSTLHAAGLEVILDVVYNHTCEGGERGPTLSFRGFDNASYYRLLDGDLRYYVNETGCGNTLNITHPRVLQLVMDSLRYWVEEMHVDGFRFDLAVSLGRETYGFDPRSGFFDAVRQDPVLASTKLIAEPWDLGPGGYQQGQFPSGWGELNGQARDTYKRFWLGENGLLPEFARRVHGSSDLFEHNGRNAHSSVNFVTSHDGFTMKDLVSYNERHNLANGEDNRDGHPDNHSCNYGVEGETTKANVLTVRERQCRNMLATLFLSLGTPLLLMGDENGRSQQGNNNGYCQDNELSWMSWSAPDEARRLRDFVARLVALRQEFAALRRSDYPHGQKESAISGLNDIQWLNPDGTSMSETEWHDPNTRWLAMVLGEAQHTTLTTPQAEAKALMVIFNAHTEAVEFNLPPVGADVGWRRLLSTAEDIDTTTPSAKLHRLAVVERSVEVLDMRIFLSSETL